MFDSEPEVDPPLSDEEEDDSSSEESEEEPRRYLSSTTCSVYGAIRTKTYAAIDSQPLVYFSLFFTTSFFALIAKETNRYAEQFLSENQFSDNSRVTDMLPVIELEMKVFIACVINMGLTRKPTIFSYWSTTSCNSTPWFPQMFSRNRFQLSLKFFHFVDNSKFTTPVDPCAKFQPLCDHANRLFRHFYIPYQQLSIDESSVGTKSHTSLMQYFTFQKSNSTAGA